MLKEENKMFKGYKLHFNGTQKKLLVNGIWTLKLFRPPLTSVAWREGQVRPVRKLP